jgi:electron transfer flavoprotein alpha subunit
MFRSGSFEATENAAAGEVVNVGVATEDFSGKASLVSQDQEQAAGPSIEEADILVCGGRGVGGPEGFGQLEALAAALGGAVASTRAVVDSGWYPYATQIGQTGKSVAPKLYLGAGVSGAIQHKVGMQSSQTIVSINKDATAPIFDFSDFGVVGDLNTVVPTLTELVKARKG